MRSDETDPRWLEELGSSASLGPKARRVLRILGNQPEFTAFASASAVAARAGTDPATVVRTARSLGFSGWPNLRLEIRNRYLASLDATAMLQEHSSGDTADPVSRALRSDLAQLMLATRTIDVSKVRRIAEAVVAANRVLVVASGAFAAPAIQFAHVAGFMGIDARFSSRGGTSLANAIAGLQDGDCVIAINLWRIVREVRDAVHLARATGISTCVITDLEQSLLGGFNDLTITVPSEGTSHFPSLTTTMAVTHALLAQVTALLGDDAVLAMERAEALYQDLGLIVDS